MQCSLSGWVQPEQTYVKLIVACHVGPQKHLRWEDA